MCSRRDRHGRVELTTPDVAGEVVADAVRLVGNAVEIQSLQKTYNEQTGRCPRQRLPCRWSSHDADQTLSDKPRCDALRARFAPGKQFPRERGTRTVSSPAPRGFTLLEITVVSGLMVFLAVLLSAAWSGIGKTTVDLVARGQLAQEIDIATASLSHDFGGSLPTPAGSLQGTRQAGKLLAWRRSLTDPMVLELCYDSGSNPNNTADWLDSDSSDTVVQYSWDQDAHALIRTQVCTGDTHPRVYRGPKYRQFQLHARQRQYTARHVDVRLLFQLGPATNTPHRKTHMQVRGKNVIGRSPNRRGYALLLVVMFTMLFVMLTGVAWRQMSSVVRNFSVRTSRIQRDEGALQALAHALRRLENGVPPADDYSCYDTIQVPAGQNVMTNRLGTAQTLQNCYYKLTFTRQPDQDGKRIYQVTVEPVPSPGTPALDVFTTNGP